ncbi:MAG: hypothetical protein IPF66_23475 [Holophagales bacterium]|nr:hypothetical protein [Holophagales bacterium]
MKVSIAGPDGRPVANLTAPGVPGLGRVSWDLKKTKDLLTEYGGLPAGRHVAPGDYRVTVTYGEGEEHADAEGDGGRGGRDPVRRYATSL